MIANYCSYVETSQFENNIDVNDYLDRNKKLIEYGEDEYESNLDSDAIIEEIEKDAQVIVEDQIDAWLRELPWDANERNILTIPYISIFGVDDLVKSYLSHDDNDDCERDFESASDRDIDFIFKR